MTSLTPTTLFMLCLIAATLLGAGIGACLWQLRSASRVDRVLASARREADAEREALDAMLREERGGAALERAEMLDAVERAHAQAERDRTRHDTLAVHAREQGRRIDALEAEVVAYEARRSVHRHDGPVAPSGPAGGHPGTSAARPSNGAHDDSDLPVLNRRVRGAGVNGGAPFDPLRSVPRSAVAVGVAASGTLTGAFREPAFPIEGDLDIPALAESELPDAADDRALGLLDTRNLFPDTDD